MIKNTTDHYGNIAKILHWSIAILVIGMIILGHVMGAVSSKPLRGDLYGLHKSFGLLILAIMILRLAWRWANPKPSLPMNIANWQQTAARFSHTLLYTIILIMPITGLIMSSAAGYPPKFFGLFAVAIPMAKDKSISHLFSDIHIYLSWVIVALVSIHILAALKHHFIDKDNVLTRMIFANR